MWTLLSDLRQEYAPAFTPSSPASASPKKVPLPISMPVQRPGAYPCTPSSATHVVMRSPAAARTDAKIRRDGPRHLVTPRLSSSRPSTPKASSSSVAVAAAAARSPSRPPPDYKKEGLVFLEKLGFHVPDQDLSAPAAMDPFRNGQLLLEIAESLEQRAVKGAVLPVNTVADCIHNTDLAVRHCRRLDISTSTLPAAVVHLIVQGDVSALWMLMHALRSAYPASKCDGDLHVLSSELPYEKAAYVQLEAALAHWVHSLGCLPWLAHPPQTLAPLLNLFGQGALLCDVVSSALGIPITGIMRPPKTSAQSLANVHKALEALRSNRSCSAELLSNPRPIAACNRVAVASILDDIHRAAFGMPVRSSRKSDRNAPFLGVWLAQKQQNDQAAAAAQADAQYLEKNERSASRGLVHALTVSLAGSRASSRATTPVTKKVAVDAAAQIYGEDDDAGKGHAAKQGSQRWYGVCVLILAIVRQAIDYLLRSDALAASARLHWGWIQSLGIRCASICLVSALCVDSAVQVPARRRALRQYEERRAAMPGTSSAFLFFLSLHHLCSRTQSHAATDREQA